MTVGGGMRAWRGRHKTYDGQRKRDKASTKQVGRQGRADEQGGTRERGSGDG